LIDKLRFVLNTHEQVCHPTQLSLLIRNCTSCDEGKSASELLSCLKDQVKINARACEFLIDLALRMELIEKDLHWSGRGWVINMLTSDTDKLTETVKIAYLKYYLDTDGALIINFLKEIDDLGEEGLLMSQFLNEGGVEKVFIKTAEEYLQEVFDISPRYELSKLMNLREKGYSSKVRTDKFLPHIEPLVDLGFIKRGCKGKLVKYWPCLQNENGKMVNYTSRLLQQFNSVLDLDRVFSKDGDFFRKASISFGLSVETVNRIEDYANMKHEILRAYDETKDPYFRLARLDSIYDIVCIRMMYPPYRKLCEESDVSHVIQQMKANSEENIRFHVDDSGVTRYITIPDNYVNNEMQKKA